MNRLVQLSHANEIFASGSCDRTSQGTLFHLRLIWLIHTETCLPDLKHISALLNTSGEASIETFKALTFFSFNVDHRKWNLGNLELGICGEIVRKMLDFVKVLRLHNGRLAGRRYLFLLRKLLF